VPQSLSEFIQIAFDLNKNLQNNNNAYSNNAKTQEENFNNFLKVYNACKDELFTKITEHLAQEIVSENL